MERITQLTSYEHSRTRCHTEVATAEGREVSRARAPDSPVPGECVDARTPGETEKSPVTKPPERWGPRKEPDRAQHSHQSETATLFFGPL